MSEKIKYSQKSQPAFTKELLSEINHYFSSRDLSKKANAFMWFKVGFFTSLYLLNWAALSFYAHSLPVTIGLFLSLIVLTLGLAFTVGHDAVHSTLSNVKWVNDAIYAFCFSLLGPNYYIWKMRHNKAHHYFVNIPGSDVDIESTELLRIAPHTPWHSFQRFQHLYAPFFYAVFTLEWILLKDFRLFFKTSFGNMENIKHPWWRFAELIVLKIFYWSYALVIPMIFLPYSAGQIIIAYMLFQFCLSILLLLIFAGSHVGESSHFVGYDDDNRIAHSFYEHQLYTSVDFNTESSLMSFVMAGFNTHVAHHMFPHICSVHYPALTRIIKRVAKKHNLPYQERGILTLWKEHFRLLKIMGQDPDSGKKFFLLPAGENKWTRI